MNQEQLNIICKILKNGAPALADELISTILALIESNVQLRTEIASLKEKENN